MLPIQELVDVAQALDSEGRWEVADRAAAAFGCPAPTFWRSSASHVFVSRSAVDGVVLRLRPDTTRHRATLQRAATVSRALGGLGAGVAAARALSPGEEVVCTRDGYCAMAVDLVPGRRYDDEDPEVVDVAAAWGAALARLHAAGARLPALVGLTGARGALAELPSIEDLQPDEASFDVTDATLAARLRVAVRRTATELSLLPRDSASYGLLHGDPEIDNLAFGANGPAFFDLDDVRMGWFAADIAFALRAWAPPAAAPDVSSGIPAAFVAGYRTVRPLTDGSLAWMPALIRAAELETLADLLPESVAMPEPGWPDWAIALHRRIVERVDRLTAALASG